MTRLVCLKTSPPLHPRLLLALLLLLLGSYLNVQGADTPPAKFAVQASATVQESPPQIRLSWPGDSAATGYSVSRRTPTSGWQHLGNISGGQNDFTDGNVSVGTKYEYKIVKTTNAGYTGYGYLASGIRVAPVDHRGRVILVVESSLGGAIGNELNQLQQNLVGDGWVVSRRTVSRSDSPRSVRQAIQEIYNSDASNTKAVFLIGNVPVPYSGDIFPDGHPNHRGAWPADLYYGEMNGTWTDSSVNNTEAERQINWNTPGDGKFDQSFVPGEVELMVGRVDFSNMTCYSNKANSRSELDLTRQYLAKNNRWRLGQVQVQQRGLICDNFADKGDDPIAGSAWRAFPGFFGAENITEVPWDGYIPAVTQGSYLWTYGSGGGTYYYSVGVGTSDDFALNNVRAVFTMWMGSYFGDWNNESNFLRAALGSGDVLTSSYSGFPHTMYFPMAMGETVGHCIRISQNNGPEGLYEPYNQAAGEVHVALHGDPTLRMHPVKPAASLTASTEPGTVRLNWSASTDSNLQGYHVYRSAASEGPFTRITSNPVSNTSFTDNPAAGTYTYMVRAIKLEQSASGTYLNPSQGITTQATVTGSVPQPPNAPVLQAQAISHSQIDLQWNDLANETGYRLERRQGTGSWSEISTFTANVASYSDTVAPATQYSYRIRAFNDAGASAYSSEVSATTPATPEPQATVQFLTQDSVTSGDWKDEYGVEGYILPAATSAPPEFLVLGSAPAASHIWEPNTTDPRAFFLSGTSNQRIASAWYGSPIDFRLTVNSDAPRQLAFYFLDWDNQGRRQTVTIRDAATGTQLDSRELRDFSAGKYLVYDIEGEVRITIIATAGSNALLNGIFAGEALPGPINDDLHMTIARTRGGGFSISLQGEAGRGFALESTRDFSNWSEVTTGQLPAVVDLDFLEVPMEFLRARFRD